MIGAIIGDIVGSAYEFHNTKDHNFPLFTKDSNYTDDTIVTMAIAYWLLNDNKQSYQGLEDSIIKICSKYPCPMGGYGGGFNCWLFSPKRLFAFDNRNGKLPYHSNSGRHPYGSWGNGSAMRVSPVGWFFDTLEETEHVAEISAAITHNHPEGIKGAQATAAAIFMARNGKSKDEIRDYIEQKYGYNLHQSWDYWHSVYDWDSSCQGTVPQAIIAFLESTTFEDAIRKAVSLGGDSDTLACITGSIAEAYYKDIPELMLKKVDELLPSQFKNIIQEINKHYKQKIMNTHSNNNDNQSKTKVYNLVILDKSGSMDCIQKEAIDGFNETLASIRVAQDKHVDTQEHYVSLAAFCGCGVDMVYDKTPINDACKLTEKEYIPCCMTPLYDAIGESVQKLKQATKDVEDIAVLVTIITDGYENASKEWTGNSVRMLIEGCKKDGWMFSFVGAGEDVVSTATTISISNTVIWEQTSEGTQKMWENENQARVCFYNKLEEDHSPEISAEERINNRIRYSSEYYEKK